MRKKKAFRGGIFFGPFEGQPTGPVEVIALPSKVLIPLQQGCDGSVEPRVEVGDTVSRGQVIGLDPKNGSSPIHSSVTGTVKQVGHLEEEDGKEGIPFVLIEGSDSGDPVSCKPLGEDFARHPAKEVAGVLFEAGVTAMNRDGIPVAQNPRGIDPNTLDTLIVSVMETGVLAISPEEVVGKRIKELGLGIRILAHALQVKQTRIAVDDESPGFASTLSEYFAADTKTVLERFRRVYPRHWDELLTEAFTGRRVPDNGLSHAVGVVCVDALTALAAFDAVVGGKPVLDQVLVLGGPGYERPGVVRAPIGMLVEEIVRPRLRGDLEVRLVEGGLLTGRIVDPRALVVTRGMRRIDAIREDHERKILAFLRPGKDLHSYGRSFLSHWLKPDRLRCDSNLHGEERACIFCASCDEVCPRDLMPYWLSKHVRADMAFEALSFNLNACIECGLCSYVCPSKISLMEDIKRGKKLVAEELVNA